MAQSLRHPPWEDLQQELLFTIANFLITNPNPNFLDIHSFRSVCNSWRSSFPPFSPPSILSPILPITTIPPPSSLSTFPFTPAVLSITVVYSLRRKIIQSELTPPSNFLLFVDEFDCRKLGIRQAFSSESFALPIFFPAKVNLLDFHAREIGRFCNLSYCCYGDDLERKFQSRNVLKVVLFDDGSAAIALFDEGKLGLIRLDLGIKFVGLCRSSEIQWDVIHDGKHIRFDDIVEYKGRVLAVDRGCRVYEIGRSSSQINAITTSTYIARGSGRRKRLVESFGVLHLVVRSRDFDVSFKVYELNLEKKKWVQINSIGDRVFFFGHEFSFSASAEEVLCPKNSFLFRQNSFRRYGGNVADDSKVFCRLDSDSGDIRVYHLDGAARVGAVELYSGSSEMFWPPPAWIWPVDRLARLGAVDAEIDAIYRKHFENFKIKYPELKVELADLSCDDYEQPGNPVADIIKHDKGMFVLDLIIRLKERLNRIRETEQSIVNGEKLVHDVLPTNGHNMSTITWNQIVESLVSAQTAKTDERHCSFDDILKRLTTVEGFHDIQKRLATNPVFVQNKMSFLSAGQNYVIFQVEKIASHLVRHHHLSYSSAG